MIKIKVSTKKDLEAIVTKTLFEEVSVFVPMSKENSLSPTDRLKEDLDLDSLDLVEVAMAVEDEFSMSVDDGVIDTWVTLGDVVNYVVEEHQRAHGFLS